MTVTPRRLSSRGWWLKRVRDSSGLEAVCVGVTSDGPVAGPTIMWSGPTLEGKLFYPRRFARMDGEIVRFHIDVNQSKKQSMHKSISNSRK